jgi:hypothetical protein
MSTDFKFYTKIRLSEVEEKTNLKIVEKEDNLYLQDLEGNLLLVQTGVFTYEDSDQEDEDTFELVGYGLNDPSNIINELVDKFDLKFLIDEDEEYLYHNGVEDIDNYLSESMKKYGY